MQTPIRSLALGSIMLIGVFPGCEDASIPPRYPPSITSFYAIPETILEDEAVQFTMHVATDIELAHGIVDYRDGTRRDTLMLSGTSDSGHTTHVYAVPGTYEPTFAVEDIAGQVTVDTTRVYVRANQLPQITSRLTGVEGAVSRVPKGVLAADPEGDSFTIAVSPVSPGLVFQFNSSHDSVIYYLADRNGNGVKQGKVTVVDQKNRTVEKVIDIQFAPRDDISGRVLDRFEGTYLAGYRPAAVMQGPFTGWVEATTSGQTARVPVDASGAYLLSKLPTGIHALRAFITNGRDSSFVAANKTSSGDQVLDIRVETNAGTGMSLGKLLFMYQTVNFRIRHGMASEGQLNGMNLKNDPAHYVYYLLGRDTTLYWLNAKHLTPEQQNWFESEIQERCLAHLPAQYRPRIIKGGPNDPAPMRSSGINTVMPNWGFVIVYANLLQQVTDSQISLWDDYGLEIYDAGRIALNGGDVSTPPYGFSVTSLVQKVGTSISGGGILQDRYFDDKTTRAEHTVLDTPSIADMKLDWQVVLEYPRFNNYIEEKYFRMP